MASPVTGRICTLRRAFPPSRSKVRLDNTARVLPAAPVAAIERKITADRTHPSRHGRQMYARGTVTVEAFRRKDTETLSPSRVRTYIIYVNGGCGEAPVTAIERKITADRTHPSRYGRQASACSVVMVKAFRRRDAEKIAPDGGNKEGIWS